MAGGGRAGYAARMDDEATRSPGWYPDEAMPGSQRYWDGDTWTEHVAPLATVPAPPSEGPGALTIARGVALGIAAIIGAVWFISGLMSADDERDRIDCEIDNANRALSGEFTREC